jgi:hypothetical protein
MKGKIFTRSYSRLEERKERLQLSTFEKLDYQSLDMKKNEEFLAKPM